MSFLTFWVSFLICFLFSLFYWVCNQFRWICFRTLCIDSQDHFRCRPFREVRSIILGYGFIFFSTGISTKRLLHCMCEAELITPSHHNTYG
jgi:hypothetical protein